MNKSSNNFSIETWIERGLTKKEAIDKIEWIKQKAVESKHNKKINRIKLEFPVGKIIGNRTIVSDEIRDGIELGHTAGPHILTRCKCGNEKWVRASKGFLNGNYRQCMKCQYMTYTGNGSPTWTGYKDMPGTIINRIKHMAQKRNLEFEFDNEAGKKYLYDIFHAQKEKCYYSGTELNWKTASLDRKDSTKGYIRNNVVWTAKKINLMKHEQSEDEFVLNCMKVVMHNKDVAEALFNSTNMTESLRDDILMDTKFSSIRKLSESYDA